MIKLTDFILRRKIALSGGTTTLLDCLTALAYFVFPRRLVNGPALSEYEAAFARRIGVRYAFSFAAGRIGLYGILRAMKIGKGDQVMLQAPTHIVVSNAICYTGAEPLYVDCSLDSYNIDLELARKLITAKTKVLLLQHTFGIPADIEKALKFADEFGLYVIEDCVHALGSAYHGKLVGSFGHAAFFSTEETKTISTAMGGMATTDDPVIANRLREFQKNCAKPSPWLTYRSVLKFVIYHFLTMPYIHRYSCFIYNLIGQRHPLPRPCRSDELAGQRPPNYEKRLANVQAVVGLRQLRRLESNIEHRQKISQIYYNYLSDSAFRLPKFPPNSSPVLFRFPVWVNNREFVVKLLKPYSVVGTWPISVIEEADSPACAHYISGSCPNAEAAAKHLVNFATHPRVKVSDAKKIMIRLTQ